MNNISEAIDIERANGNYNEPLDIDKIKNWRYEKQESSGQEEVLSTYISDKKIL